MPVQQKPLKKLVQQHLREFFAAHHGSSSPSGLYKQIMCEIERSVIKETLRATRGNQVKASEILGINRNTLRKKMQDLGLIRKQQKKP